MSTEQDPLISHFVELATLNHDDECYEVCLGDVKDIVAAELERVSAVYRKRFDRAVGVNEPVVAAICLGVSRYLKVRAAKVRELR